MTAYPQTSSALLLFLPSTDLQPSVLHLLGCQTVSLFVCVGGRVSAHMWVCVLTLAVLFVMFMFVMQQSSTVRASVEYWVIVGFMLQVGCFVNFGFPLGWKEFQNKLLISCEQKVLNGFLKTFLGKSIRTMATWCIYTLLRVCFGKLTYCQKYLMSHLKLLPYPKYQLHLLCNQVGRDKFFPRDQTILFRQHNLSCFD